MSAATWAIVVAGGEGKRFGSLKQFATLGDRSVVAWAVDAALQACDAVVLVLPTEAVADRSLHCDASVVVAGGATRSASVRAGLGVVPDDVDIVVVHDAARPLATPHLFASVIDAVRQGADAAVPGVLVADTLKRVHNGSVVETVSRDGLYAIQTPQAFRMQALQKAHRDGQDATDDAGLVEAIGGEVVVVAGEARNVKLTEASELSLFASWMKEREGSTR